MKRSPAIPPRATSLVEIDGTDVAQVTGISDLITREDSSSRSPYQSASSSKDVVRNEDLLEIQRRELVADIAENTRNSTNRAQLDEIGKSVFKQAGFQDRIDRPSDIEVTTSWLKPVVQVSCFAQALRPVHE